MSGHSKWHNIQKTKGAADAKRSATFTKIAKEIIVAVKQGGSGDPANNSRLATVVAKAKAANMPNDNIKRTIDKALGSGNTDNYEAVTYEGYGPCGVAVIVEALTDNRQRTAPEIRHYFDKFGKGWMPARRIWRPTVRCSRSPLIPTASTTLSRHWRPRAIPSPARRSRWFLRTTSP